MTEYFKHFEPSDPWVLNRPHFLQHRLFLLSAQKTEKAEYCVTLLLEIKIKTTWVNMA